MKYLIPIVFLLSSCRTVNKLFHKDKERIDSTSVSHTSTIEQKHIDTSKRSQIVTSRENSIEVDLASPVDSNYKVDTAIISSYGVPMSDYFLLIDRKTGKISSNQPITHVTIKGLDEVKYSNFTGGIDSSVLKNDSSGVTHLQKHILKVDKSVNKKLSFASVIYWGIGILILLIILYLVYRYRKFIFSFLKIPPL